MSEDSGHEIARLHEDVKTISDAVAALVKSQSVDREKNSVATLAAAIARQLTLPQVLSIIGGIAVLFVFAAWLVSALMAPLSARLDVADVDRKSLHDQSTDNRQRITDIQAANEKLRADQKEQCTNFEDQLRSLNEFINLIKDDQLLAKALEYQAREKLPFPPIKYDPQFANSEHCG